MENLCSVHDDFFSSKLLTALSSLLGEKRERKLEFVLGEAPRPIEQCAKIASNALDLSFNYSILKRYRASDEYRSGAYDFHVDPKHFQSIPLVLCTVSGGAKLDFRGPDQVIHSLECQPNRVIVLRSDLPHRVSEPYAPTNEREFLFLGHDSRPDA